MDYTSIKSSPGLYFRLDKNQNKIYYARLFHNGHNYGFKNLTKLKGANTLTQAKTAKTDIIAILNRGENPFELHKAKMTLIDDYFLDYLKDISTHSEKAIQGKKWFYNKHLKHLGKFAPSQITPEHLIKILNTTLNGKKWRTLKEFQTILNTIFRKAERKGVFSQVKNPFDNQQVKLRMDKIKEEVATPLPERLKIELEPFARMLYCEIVDIEIDNTKKLWIKHFETKIVMLIALMCARRRGEILKYKYENLDFTNEYTRVDVPAKITKTNVKDSFPLPIIVTELIEELREIKGDESNNGLIFSSLEEHMPTLHFRKVIQKIQKRENCIVLGEKFTLHICRHLFATIIAVYRDAFLADLCISHLPPKMMRTYNSTPYKVRAEVFFEYWGILSKDS